MPAIQPTEIHLRVTGARNRQDASQLAMHWIADFNLMPQLWRDAGAYPDGSAWRVTLRNRETEADGPGEEQE